MYLKLFCITSPIYTFIHTYIHAHKLLYTYFAFKGLEEGFLPDCCRGGYTRTNLQSSITQPGSACHFAIHTYIHTCKNMLIWLIVYVYAYLDEHIQFMIYIFTHIHRYYFCRDFLLVVSAISVANQCGGLRVIQGGAMG